MIRPGVPLDDHRVVDGGVAASVERDLQGRQRQHRVVAREDPAEAGLELVARDRGQEPDPAEVRPDHRHAAVEEARQRAQHRAVAAERDRDLRRPPARVLAVEEQLDAGTFGDRSQARHGLVDVPRHARA